MNKFILGFIAGAATYHYVSGGFNNEELVSELRGVIQSLDDRLADMEPKTTPDENVDEIIETPQEGPA